MSSVFMQTLVGAMDTSPHATFTKFDPRFDAGMHTHTNDVSIVVVKGAYLYTDEAGEKRVGPGEYLFVPGGNTGAAATRPKAHLLRTRPREIRHLPAK